jgi:hypothetical protein
MNTRGSISSLRADGATQGAVRAFWADHGLKLKYAAVGRLLANRAVLGELHFGSYTPNLKAWDAIVDPDLFNRVQRIRVSSGRKAKSERLLARLGVLRCASCGGRMSASTGHHGTVAIYKCGAHAGDPCPCRVHISAELVEGVVVDAVREALADEEGRATAETHAQEAYRDLERAQTKLDSATATFIETGLADEPAARAGLVTLREARDDAQKHVDDLALPADIAITVNASRDWDRFTLDERRTLIKATVESVGVPPGRGADRVAVTFIE